MSRYAKGAQLERDTIKAGIKSGAILGMRGAGSKSYGQLKVDVVLLYEDRLVLIQCKKSKQRNFKEKKQFHIVKLPETVRVLRDFIEVR